jgi:hypothetical protein
LGYGTRFSSVVGLAIGLWGCSSSTGHGPEVASAARAPSDAAGLRVALSGEAKSVCVSEHGCAEGPKGAFKIRPLEPEFRAAVSETLQGLGFQLVGVEAERDLVADVEWRGTDTIALRLQDGHGRLIEQASFSRSLERCQKLPELTWGTCWAANFDGMKEALSRPLERSPALLAFARKLKQAGAAGALAAEVGPSGSEAVALPSAPGGGLPKELDGLAIERTLAQNQRGLERSCWLPALEAREPSAPTAARVATVVTIGPSGRVERVTTAGDPPGYLHLSACVVTHLKSWRFPAAQRATTTSVPFVFAGD